MLELLLPILVGAIGSVVSSVISYKTSKDTNAENQQIAQQENWITRQREDTAIQRRAQDLQAAGINPMLAGIQGAQTSPGQIISMQAPQMDLTGGFKNIMSAITEGQKMINSDVNEKSRIELETKRLIDDLKTSETTRQKLKQEIASMSIKDQNVMQDTLLKIKESEKIDSDILTQSMQRALISAQTTTERARLGEIAAHINQMNENAKLQKSENQINQWTRLIKQQELQQSYLIREKIKAEIEYLMKSSEAIDNQAVLGLMNSISNIAGAGAKLIK